MGFCPSCGLSYPEGHSFCPLDGTQLTAPEDPFLGKVVAGKYRVVSLIGEGGMGVVYAAQHVHVDRKVAVKVLPRELSQDREVKERFFREARAATTIRHENVVEIYELDETEDGMAFMAMELLDGCDLSELIAQEGRLPVERAVPILRQICSVLGPTHAMDVVHRDLKPDNVFLVEREDNPDFVKVLDFGVALMLNEPRLTSQGLVLGTPEYMSPELVTGGTPGPAADLYAVGCIGYAMVAGHPPFHDQPLVQTMTAQAMTPPPPLGEECPDVPPAFESIIMQLLEKDPEKRYPDAYGIIRDLDTFMPPIVTEKVRVSRVSVGPRKRIEIQGMGAMESEHLGSWKNFTDRSRGKAGTRTRQVLYEMEELTGELESLGSMKERVVQVMETIERECSETQRRIQYAVDELAQDASAKRSRLMRRRSQLTDLKEDLASLDLKLTVKLAELGGVASRAGQSGVDEEILGECIRLGQMAGRRRELALKGEEVAADVETLQEQVKDIAFQIESLRNRLDGVDREAQEKLAEQKSAMDTLEKQRADVESRLVNLSSRVGARM